MIFGLHVVSDTGYFGYLRGLTHHVSRSEFYPETGPVVHIVSDMLITTVMGARTAGQRSAVLYQQK